MIRPLRILDLTSVVHFIFECTIHLMRTRLIFAYLLVHLPKTFKVASNEIQRIVCSPEVTKYMYLFTNLVTWKFIAECTLWWGDFWERMVRLVKYCLGKVLVDPH